MRIRLGIPDELDDRERKEALDAALEAVTLCAESQVRRGTVPPAARAIKAGKVRWKPEPPGDEHFDLPGTVLGRGWGDCDDLAPWHAGTLRATGTDPQARAIVKKSGPTRWHAVVRRGDGSIDDPSKHAGMGSGVNGEGHHVVGAGPAIHQPMSDGRMCLAICPSRDPRHPSIWFARLDVPDIAEPWAWSSMAGHPHPAAAVVRAVKAVRQVAGDELDGLDDARLAALHDLLAGCDPEDIADALEQEAGDELDVDGCVNDAVNCVGFLDSITKPFRKLIPKPFRKIAKGAMPFFAGFGGPHAQIFSAISKGDPMSAFGAMRGAHAGMPQGDPRPAFERAKEFFSQHPLGPAALPFAQNILPTMFPGAGSLFMSMATPQQMQMPQAAPRPPASPSVPYGPETWTFGMEPGVVAQPWGNAGPAVMRF